MAGKPLREKKKKTADVQALYALGTGYWGSGVAIAATKLGIFTELDAGPMVASALAKRLRIKAVGAEKLLAACASLGLVGRTADGAYANTEMASTFLVKGKPTYQGELFTYFKDLWTRFSELDYIVAQGRLGPRETAEADARTDEEKKESERAWVMAMHNIAMSGQADALCAAVALGNHSRLLDVAGGVGTYSVFLTRAFPNLRAVVLDAPEIVTVAEEVIAGFEAADRVTTRGGDFLYDSYGKDFDVILYSGVLHAFDEAGVKRLLKKAFQSLPSGGTLLVQEMLPDGASDGPMASFPALFGFNMMAGGTYPADHLAGLMAGVGFEGVETHRLADGAWFNSVLVGHKP